MLKGRDPYGALAGDDPVQELLWIDAERNRLYDALLVGVDAEDDSSTVRTHRARGATAMPHTE